MSRIGTGLVTDQSLRLTQEHRINPRLYQAMELVYLPLLDLQTRIEQELSENPFLELSEDEESTRDLQLDEEGPEDGDDEVDWDTLLLQDRQFGVVAAQGDVADFYDRPAVNTRSLRVELLEQIGLLHLDDRQIWIAEEIIGNIRDDGLLACSVETVLEGLEASRADFLEQLAGLEKEDPGEEEEDHEAALAEVTLEEVTAVLEIVQSLDPAGIAGRDLRDSLMIQLRRGGRGDSLAYQLLEHHYDDLVLRRWGAMAKELETSLAQVQAAGDELAELNPRPGREYSSEADHYVVADLIVEKVGDSHVVMTNDTGLPRLRIAHSYRELAQDPDRFEGDNKAFIVNKLNAAQWLLQAIEQRRQTVLKVMRCIVDVQGEFFDKGIHHLKPLTLQEVADQAGMVESTVSRVTNEKYVQSPQGVHSLKFFFSGGLPTVTGDQISTRRVREMIRALVANEDQRRPLTDQALVNLLKSEGVKIARRTVAKYRDRMGVLPARMRRRI